MLRADNLCFTRNAAAVLGDVSLSVSPAQLLKITGGNGGGKTTLLKLLCLLLPPDSGELYWQDTPVSADADAYREHLLYIGHRNALADDLSPLENLRTAAALRQRPPKQALTQALTDAGLQEQLNTPCRYLSAGQKRRAALARLLAFPAELWLLDEPLAALDGGGREMMKQHLQAHLAGGGMAVCTMHHREDWEVPSAAVLHCAAN